MDETVITDKAINEQLIGLTALNQNVALLNYGNVVINKYYKQDSCVRILSAGSDTSYAAFVGKGMLTAAIIQGEAEKCQASTSKIILRTIRELSMSRSKGVLVIVQSSNSSDVLNFGIAVERSISDNLNVKLLCITENIDRTTSRTTDLGGVVLINKIAGAMSEKCKILSAIYDFCKKCTENIFSIAISSKNIMLVKKMKLSQIDSVNGLVENILNSFKPLLPLHNSVVIIVNNVTALSKKSDEYVLVKELIPALNALSINIHRLYIGNFLTFPSDCNIELTVTVLKVFNPEILDYLDTPNNVPGWNNVNQGIVDFISTNPENLVINGVLKDKDRFSLPVRGPKLSEKAESVCLFALKFALDALISCEKQINIIDSETSEGNLGTRLKKLSKNLHKQIKSKKLITSHPFTLFESLSKMCEKHVGGKLGGIYGILFQAAAIVFGKYTDNNEVTGMMWIKALENSCDSITRYGNVAYGDHTLYDVLVDCTNEIKSQLDKIPSGVAEWSFIVKAFEKGAEVAQITAQNCKKLPGQKHPDAGAHSVGIWLRALCEGMKMKC